MQTDPTNATVQPETASGISSAETGSVFGGGRNVIMGWTTAVTTLMKKAAGRGTAAPTSSAGTESALSIFLSAMGGITAVTTRTNHPTATKGTACCTRNAPTESVSSGFVHVRYCNVR